MTGAEAIPKITGLLGQLIGIVKDRQTGQLVGQVQSLFQSLQTDYSQGQMDLISASRAALKLEREHAQAMQQLEASHAQLVESLKASQAQEVAELKSQIERLKAQNAPSSEITFDSLTEPQQKILLWLFKNGTNFCPRHIVRNASEETVPGMFEAHITKLDKLKLIKYPMLMDMSRGMPDLAISEKGRMLVAESGRL